MSTQNGTPLWTLRATAVRGRRQGHVDGVCWLWRWGRRMLLLLVDRSATPGRRTEPERRAPNIVSCCFIKPGLQETTCSLSMSKTQCNLFNKIFVQNTITYARMFQEESAVLQYNASWVNGQINDCRDDKARKKWASCSSKYYTCLAWWGF
jgi:hypothetical protein